MTSPRIDPREEIIRRAACWLTDQPAPPAHVVPTLRERFGLNAIQACEAIAFARSTPISRQPDFIGVPSDEEGAA